MYLVNNVDLILAGIAIAAMAVIGFVALFSNLKSSMIRAFFLFTLSAIFWNITNYLALKIIVPDIALWNLRFNIFIAILYSFFLHTFVLLFPQDHTKLSKWYKLLLLPITIVSAILTLTPWTFASVASLTATGQIATISNGPGIGIFGLTVGYLIISSIIILIKKIKGLAAKKAQQGKLILIGFTITFTLYLIFNFLLPAFLDNTRFIVYGSIYTFPLIAMTGYSILRHKLFNVKVVATAALVLIISVLNLFNVVFAENFFAAGYQSVIFILLLFIGILLIRSVINEVRRREETEQINNSLRALRDITRKITQSLDFSEVTQELVDEVTSRLKYKGALVLTVGKDKKTVKAVTVSNTPEFKKALRILPKKFDKFTGTILDGSKSAKIILTGRIQKSATLSDFVSPALSPRLAKKMQEKISIQSVVGVPVTTEDIVKGVLIFGLAKPVDKILDREVQTMKSLGDQLGIITRNIDIIKELKRLDQAKSDFLSIASHQLRTPISATKGYISMILEGDFGKVPASTKQALNKVYIANNRLINLINDLLNVSRIEKGRMLYHMLPQDISQIIKEVVDVIAPQIKQKGLKLNVQIPKNLPMVMADKEKLRQMIMNLTDNSIKYTQKGHIDLAIKKDPTSHTLLYSVKDTGMGIAKKDLPHLFKRFSRGTNASILNTEGTGLGLYVAKQIATAHHANVWAESDGKGKGAQIYLEIPYARKNKS